MEEDCLFFFFPREIGPCVAVSAGPLRPTWFAGRFQSWEGPGAPAGGSSGLSDKTLQPHTFSRCMRREAKGQLRGELSAEKFPTQLLLLFSAKNVTFWNGTLHISLSPSLVLRGHPSWCPCNQRRPSWSPEDFWSGSPSGLVCPSSVSPPWERTGQGNLLTLQSSLILNFHAICAKGWPQGATAHSKIPALTRGSPGSVCKQQHLGSCKCGATRFKPLFLNL